MSATNRVANRRRSPGAADSSEPLAAVAAGDGRGSTARNAAYRIPVTTTRAVKTACASAVATSRPSVLPNRSTSGAASRPPTTAPTGKPATMRGNRALMPAMSRIRPACAPMNTKPSWMSTGNSAQQRRHVLGDLLGERDRRLSAFAHVVVDDEAIQRGSRSMYSKKASIVARIECGGSSARASPILPSRIAPISPAPAR